MIVYNYNNKIIEIKKDYIAYYSEGVLYSKSYIKDPLKYSFYLVSTVWGLINGAKKILILGTGLGTAVQQMKVLIPESEITTVDIDEEVIGLAKKYLELSKYQDVKFIVEDAIEFIKKDNNSYDYIMVDLSNGASLLGDVLSIDFFKNLYGRLGGGGVLAFNSSMRDFGHLEVLCNIKNPIKFIYHNMHRAGFEDIIKLDYGYSGWIHCFKTNFSAELKKIDSIKSNSKYISLALDAQKIFNHKININDMCSLRFEDADVILMYRDFLINLIMKLRRGKIPSFDCCEGEKEILKLFINYTRKRVGEIGGNAARNLFLCNDINYFIELNKLLVKYQYSLENVSRMIMLPEKEILSSVGEIMIDKKFQIYGKFQYDIVGAK